MPQMDVTTPLPTVPVINPSSNPTATTTYSNPIPSPYTTPANPYTTPAMGIPSSSSSGRSWCIASQTASQTALQVALDYACGYGGADCSEIQAGASCNNPDTVRDHASYAFNSYYQKNPIPTSCDFGGTAVITNVDPSEFQSFDSRTSYCCNWHVAYRYTSSKP
ncbi:Glucan endo-1,3-beta-glucosidase 1 [Apostasia shenzhenica]|uniref:Glucan endo-1,3-beta-glucosidase 1 n=1 Tax=Apostasia shenzhenica TaxID=1088818 RepID=A0A2I0B2K0_9ASPA|nr:Glucan endo-1,3-beta-glucosidase 1 [Apostasia shenzhenica]